jgi:hypothetical protein
MSQFDNLRDQAEGQLSEHGDQVENLSDQGFEQAGDAAESATGGQYSDQIDQGQEQTDSGICGGESGTGEEGTAGESTDGGFGPESGGESGGLGSEGGGESGGFGSEPVSDSGDAERGGESGEFGGEGESGP